MLDIEFIKEVLKELPLVAVLLYIMRRFEKLFVDQRTAAIDLLTSLIKDNKELTKQLSEKQLNQLQKDIEQNIKELKELDYIIKQTKNKE